MISAERILNAQFPSLAKQSKRRKVLYSLFKYLLHEKELCHFSSLYPRLSGFELIEKSLEHLDFSIATIDKEVERIPVSGRVVIIANHPIGSLDGFALLHLIRKLRPDVKVVANQMLMAIESLHEVLLPVNNMNGNSAKRDLLKIHDFLAQEGAVVIFPAGEVSRFTAQGIKDSSWHKGFLTMASRAKAPILPVHIKARNSLLFYTSSLLYKPLASLLLVKEMFKHQKSSIKITIGKLIPYESYGENKLSSELKVKLLKKEVYRIAKNKQSLFKTESPIAHPSCKIELKHQIERCERLGNTTDGKQIYLYKGSQQSIILKELGRLREITFRSVGEGTGNKRDLDKFDDHYLHLILWDSEAIDIVGAYRFTPILPLIEQQGIGALYSNQLFDYENAMDNYFESGIELGRSFVQPKYWGKKSLEYLWQGIGAYLAVNPKYRYLIGPVSLSASLPKRAHAFLIAFYLLYFPASSYLANAKNGYCLSDQLDSELMAYFSGDDYAKDFIKLKAMMANMGVSVPTLYKQYTELCDEGGVQFVDFNIDADFNHCIDGLVIVDLQYLKAKKQLRYIDIHHNNG